MLDQVAQPQPMDDLQVPMHNMESFSTTPVNSNPQQKGSYIAFGCILLSILAATSVQFLGGAAVICFAEFDK